MNAVLRVDLSSGDAKKETLDESTLRKFLGGRGLGAKVLYEELEPHVDALSPGNKLIFAVGPLTGTISPTSGRMSVSTKSPLTSTVLDANAGGNWGPALKRAGYDALIIEGAAEDPSILIIGDDQVRIIGGKDYWGMKVHATTESLTSLDGGKFNVACIGPAGEKLALISSIMFDKTGNGGRGGVAARGGPGAVMGSKKLKAVLVRGSNKIQVADRDSLKFFVAETRKKLSESPITSRALPRFGTDVLMNVINAHGLLPVNNFQKGYSDRADEVSGESLTEKILKKRSACFGCPIGCGRKTATNGMSGDGPEYETVFALGPECGVFDLSAVTEANYLCNDYGLDTISTGVTIGCAMELRQRGVIKDDIEFGDGERVKSLIPEIAERKGIGDAMAVGSRKFAEGLGAPQYSMSVKGMELPAYDPRGAQGMALAYATSNRGGCHLRGYMIGWEILGVPKLIDRFNWSGKADLLVRGQDLYAAMDSLIVCKFIGYNVNQEYLGRLLTATTGVEYSQEDIMEVGERTYTLERAFNVREGFERSDDQLPERFTKEPLDQGGSQGTTVSLQEMLDEYYGIRGWDSNGAPTRETLDKLGLDFVAV
jgi:aldehyde:ferredoxin oxidoreductase